MLVLIATIAFVCFMLFSLLNDDTVDKQCIYCKLRDKGFVPHYISDVIRKILFSNFYSVVFCKDYMKEIRNSLIRLTRGIILFFVPYYFIKFFPDLFLLWWLLQLLVIYWIIKTPLSVDICDYYFGKTLCWLFFLCVASMLIMVWADAVLSMVRYLYNEKIDDAVICINIFLCLTVGFLYAFYSKWSRRFGNSSKALWNTSYLLNIVLILFAFGMLNLVHADQSPGKADIGTKVQEDTRLLYFGRFVYAGAIPAIYGKDFIDRTFAQTNNDSYLSTVYKLGMSFNYDELIVLDEFVFLAGYVCLGFTLKPYK